MKKLSQNRKSQNVSISKIETFLLFLLLLKFFTLEILLRNINLLESVDHQDWDIFTFAIFTFGFSREMLSPWESVWSTLSFDGLQSRLPKPAPFPLLVHWNCFLFYHFHKFDNSPPPSPPSPRDYFLFYPFHKIDMNKLIVILLYEPANYSQMLNFFSLFTTFIFTIKFHVLLPLFRSTHWTFVESWKNINLWEILYLCFSAS